MLGRADRGRRLKGDRRGGARWPGPATRPVRTPGCPRRDGHARPRRRPHAPPVRRHTREGAPPPPEGRGLPRDPGRRRRHPLHGRGDPRGRRRNARRARRAMARRDAVPRHDDDRGQVGLRARSADRAAPPRDRLPAGSFGPGRGRSDVPRRARRPSRVPDAAGRHGGLRPERDRGSDPRRGGPGPGAVLRRVLRAGRVHGRPEPAGPGGRGGLRDERRACTPTRSRHRAARSWPPNLAPRRPTTSRHRPRPGSRPSPGPPTRTGRSSRRSCRRRPGSS